MHEENGILRGPLAPALIRFAIPLMFSLILQALYGAVDLAVVGKFDTTEQAAGVAVGSQVMQAVTTIVTGLTMGVTVCIGQAVGSGDLRRAGSVVAGQIKLFAAVCVGLTAALLLLADPINVVMNVPREARPATAAYLRICGAGMIFITVYNAISGIFRGLGNSKVPFLFVAVSCAVNVVLDLLLVAVFHLGAAGAALATIFSQGVSVAFSLAYMRKKGLPFPLNRESFRESGAVRDISRIGGPIALQDFLKGISFLAITGAVNVLGLNASNGLGITEKLFVFLSIVPMSFLSALSAFVAQNVGANQPQRAVAAAKVAMGISMAFGVAVFLMAFFGGKLLVSIFTDQPPVIAEATAYLRSSSPEYLLTAIDFCLLGYFNGLGRTRFVMIQSLGAAFLLRVPLSFVFSHVEGASMSLLGLAVPISALAALLASLWYFRRVRKLPVDR